jgi:UDP-N-acetylmuramyl pentapeptide phosphotransferase/UDP-N-acetylglucosamine-1-phosphate transferase
MIISLKSASYAALASFLACGLILLTRRWHDRFTLDGNHGIQKVHETSVPRIGGLGLMIGLFTGWWVQEDSADLTAADHLLGLTLLASIPAFAAGIAEDITKRVSVRTRLLATMASGLLAYWATGYCIGRVDIWGLDSLLAWAPICVLFTAFAVAGVANAYNIIDGFNGLTSAAMVVAVGAMSAIAFEVGDTELVYFSLIYIAAILGFMAWNYPLGRLFLGDGGAYAMGFLIAWLAVMLPARHPEVSPWASLMACGYPVMETIYTMLWRWLTQQSSGAPDALHLHSLVKKVVIRPRYQRVSAVLRNAMVTVTLMPFVAIIAATGVLFYRDTVLLMSAFGLYFVVYILAHRALFHSKFAHDATRASK